MVAILKTIRNDVRFSPDFKHLATDRHEQVARDLAHEVAFLPAMQGLIDSTKRSTTGPKPKTALSILATQVRETLMRYEVELKHWKNGRGGCNDLANFCTALVGLSGERVGVVSARTIEKAPSQGFR